MSQMLDHDHLCHRSLYSAVAKDMTTQWTTGSVSLLDLGCGGASNANRKAY